MINDEHFIRLPLNGARNALPVARAEEQYPEDQEVERALEKRNSLAFVFSGRHAT